MSYCITDPITKNADFECEASSPGQAARQWLSCQRTFREATETDKVEDLTTLYVSRHGGFTFPIPIVRIA